MEGDVQPGSGRDHLRVSDRPRVRVVGLPVRVIADHGLWMVEVLPAGGMGLLIDADLAARLDEGAVDAGGRAVSDDQPRPIPVKLPLTTFSVRQATEIVWRGGAGPIWPPRPGR